MSRNTRNRLFFSTLLRCLTLSALTSGAYAADAATAITLDYRSDRLVRLSESPTLSIYADGRIEMPQIYAHSQSYESQLSEAEFTSLMEFIVSENRFFDYGNDQLSARSRISDPRRHVRFAHNTRTVFYVQDAEQSRRISIPGLENAPNPDQTGRLRAIRDRLEQIMAVVKLGGTEAANHWLMTANEELQAVYPDAAPMSLSNLHSGTQRSDGSIYVQFARVEREGSDPLRVSISVNASGEYGAAVNPRPQ